MSSVEKAAATEASPNGAGERIPVESPATGEIIGSVPDLSAAQIAALAKAARAAQPAWEALGFAGRSRILLRMQRWVMDNSERLIDTLVAETGKTYEDAQNAEVAYTANALGFWARRAAGYLADEQVPATTMVVKGKRMVVRRRPVGLVGVIGPWNYPLINGFGDCIPALAAGNAVVLKPSSVTPLTSLVVADALRECGLPDGVFAVATGRGPVGSALIDEADMVMFTGSTETGREVMARAAQTLTPVSLELGGNDPLIVLADADLERAANHALYYSMLNTGQTCVGIERAYVEAPVYDEFVAKVTAKARALRHGRSTGPATADVGAMTTPGQLEVVARHVEDAVARGARAVVGGHRGEHARGSWYEPTVLVDVDQDMAIMREETFGPTLPIMKVADEQEAVRLANDSPYGLSAYVFTGDAARGERIAGELQAGTVCVNDAVVHYLAVELPMGGWKASGLGVRHGAGGILKYTRQQAVMVSRLHLRREVFMFPYDSRRTRAMGRFLRLLYGRGRRA